MGIIFSSFNDVKAEHINKLLQRQSDLLEMHAQLDAMYKVARDIDHLISNDLLSAQLRIRNELEDVRDQISLEK
jgi:hypothetical protein